ncbi:hypothetical protein [Rugamonas apoptosis]|uniref:Uncharacterized protein n=1 Tax=Rugamonas apoptosis TaxID=2758570 RepID=A0A7W2FF80_9BURK|nr:hypothetical protein [Rugamonas apoptosis]MBA5690539.1 hypothetical protein [Rugamonas apoptosis]
MPADSRIRLRTLITESYKLPPLRFRVGALTVDPPRLCRTAREACDVARELGATRIEFILPDRPPVVFGLRQRQWRTHDEASLEDQQRHLDRYCLGAIGDRFNAAIKRGREPASLFSSHAHRDLIELRQIQDPNDFERAASSMIRLASINAPYRYALSGAVAPHAQTSQNTAEKVLMRMVAERMEVRDAGSSPPGSSGLAVSPPRRSPDTGRMPPSLADSDAGGTRPGNALSGQACAATHHDRARLASDSQARERYRNV